MDKLENLFDYRTLTKNYPGVYVFNKVYEKFPIKHKI
jgi:hypothetical protein